MITDEFKVRIGKVTLALAKFVDRNGIWAKSPELCTEVQYTFVDAHSGSMTFAEYKTLTSEQKLLLRYAPSSPAV